MAWNVWAALILLAVSAAALVAMGADGWRRERDHWTDLADRDRKARKC